MVLLSVEGQVKARFDLFGHSANLDMGHVGSHFFLFGDSVSVGAI